MDKDIRLFGSHSDGLCNRNSMTEKQEGEDGAEAAQIFETSDGVTDMGGILENGRKDAQAPAFIKLLQDADVFANCKSWKVRYRAKAEDVYMPLSTSGRSGSWSRNQRAGEKRRGRIAQPTDRRWTASPAIQAKEPKRSRRSCCQ